MTDKKHPTAKTGRKPKVHKNDMSFKRVIAQVKSLTPAKVWAGIKGMDRNMALVLSLVLILVFVGGLALLTGGSGEVEEETSTQVVIPTDSENLLASELTTQEGTVEFKTEETDWQEVDDETTLAENESIRTRGAASRAVITFEGGSELRVDGNSEVQLTTLSKDRIVIRHLSGHTYNRVVESDNTIYVVTSNDAQYEAQGTAFRTSVTGDGNSVEVYQSSVVETKTNTNVAEGEKLTVISTPNPSNNGKIERLSIENLKEDPFIIWNRELDIANDTFKNKLGFLSDIEAPEITVDITDGEIILLEPNAKKGTIELSGTANGASQLRVQTNSGDSIDVSVSEDGTFKTPVLSAPVGQATFTFEATDRTGNKSEKKVRVTFQRKSSSVNGSATGAIFLSATSNDKKVKLEWSLTGGLKADDGVQVVYGTSPNPMYGSAMASQQNGNNWNEDITNFTESGTYYFRACVYNSAEDTCNNYSNQVSVEIGL